MARPRATCCRIRATSRAVYQIRSTASGELPTDADCSAASIRAPGDRDARLEDAALGSGSAQRAGVLKTFSTFLPTPPSNQSATVRPGAGARERRRRLARRAPVLRLDRMPQVPRRPGPGHGPSAPTLKATPGGRSSRPICRQNWRFNGGGTVEDIYHRLRTGLDGHPDASFSDSSTEFSPMKAAAGGSRSTAQPLARRAPRGPATSFTAPGTGLLPRSPADLRMSRIDILSVVPACGRQRGQN